MIFCPLEKNDKNYTYVRLYYKAILENTPPMVIDSRIQKNEIEEYLFLNSLSPDNQKAIDEWIRNNSSSFRCYLNSLKMLALSLYFMNHNSATTNSRDINPGLFYHAINIWNAKTQVLTSSVFT